MKVRLMCITMHIIIVLMFIMEEEMSFLQNFTLYHISFLEKFIKIGFPSCGLKTNHEVVCSLITVMSLLQHWADPT